jgi:hypothetical protein
MLNRTSPQDMQMCGGCSACRRAFSTPDWFGIPAVAGPSKP